MAIENYAAHTGRFLKEDDTAVNIADILEGIGTKTATIAQGASQSGVIDLEGYQLAEFHMPTAWDAAAITFLTSPTVDGTFQPLYDDSGVEVSIVVAASKNTAIVSAALALAGARFVKIRSGVAATPVVQTAARTIVLSLKR